MACIITCEEDLANLTDGNTIQGAFPQMTGSTIEFRGTNGCVYFEEGAKLAGSTIILQGDQALVYVAKSSHPARLKVTVWNKSTFAIGKNYYINGNLSAIASEGRSIVIGRDALISFGIWMRTSDVHMIYTADTGQRVNVGKDIFIGDHVWLGQDSMILKGTTMGSGSILGAKALLTGKVVPSNTSWGGVPAKQLGSGIFFEKPSAHNFGVEETEASMQSDSGTRFVYTAKSSTLFSTTFADDLYDHSVEERLERLQKAYAPKGKNRFAVNPPEANKPETAGSSLRRLKKKLGF